MPVITTIDDLKQIYKRRVPKMFYDYAETGSWTEQTFLENSADFQELYFRQKIAVNMEGRSTETTMIGPPCLNARSTSSGWPDRDAMRGR